MSTLASTNKEECRTFTSMGRNYELTQYKPRNAVRFYGFNPKKYSSKPVTSDIACYTRKLYILTESSTKIVSKVFKNSGCRAQFMKAMFYQLLQENETVLQWINVSTILMRVPIFQSLLY